MPPGGSPCMWRKQESEGETKASGTADGQCVFWRGCLWPAVLGAEWQSPVGRESGQKAGETLWNLNRKPSGWARPLPDLVLSKPSQSHFYILSYIFKSVLLLVETASWK